MIRRREFSKLKRRRLHLYQRERWLISYADLATLLLAFFVVLYAVSRLDAERLAQLAASFQSSFEGAKPRMQPPTQPAEASRQEFNDLRESLEQLISDHELRRRLSIRPDRRGLILSLTEAGFYEPGSERINEAAEPIIASLARHLRRLPNQIRVEGHTDNVPIRSSRFPSNWELSTARATYMVSVLIERYGLPPHRLAAAGYGEYRPVADNATADGRMRNRRVDIVVLNSTLAETENP